MGRICHEFLKKGHKNVRIAERLTVHASAGKAALVEQVAKMYGSPLHSDVAILVDRTRIPAHRHVLSTHSKVFQRMWEHEHSREVRHPTAATSLALDLLGVLHHFSRAFRSMIWGQIIPCFLNSTCKGQYPHHNSQKIECQKSC